MQKAIVLFFITLCLCACQESAPLNGRVKIETIDGQARITVAGEVYSIKGLSGSSYLKEAAQIGANTIRTYDTTNLQSVLDSAHKYGLMVVAGIWLPKSNQKWLYENDEQTEKLSSELAAIGRKYSQHPALLSWCLGNELVFYNLYDLSFSRTYNILLDSLRLNDPNHPVGTAFANFGQKAAVNFALKIKNLDYLLINTFGRLRELTDDMSSLKSLYSKPFLIGEFGENGPWETIWTTWGAPIEPKSSEKVEVLKKRFSELPKEHPQYLGALVFNWGWRQEQTHTWFNVFSEKGEKNALYYYLAEKYGHPQKGGAPLIGNLRIDGENEANQFWFETNDFHQASLEIDSIKLRKLNIKWSLRSEDWYFIKADTPPALPGLIQVSEDPRKISFKCPSKPGPYRLFVKVTDSLGNFASANLPFYVVQ